MLTERAKRRIDSQQLCNFTALDKQTKHELMVNKRRLMLQSRQMVGGAVAACRELGCSQGLPALHAHAHAYVVRDMWGRRTWRKGGSPHSRRPVYANPMSPPGSYPHSARCTRPATSWTWMKTRSNRWCNRTAVCRPRRSGPWGRSDAILYTIHSFPFAAVQKKQLTELKLSDVPPPTRHGLSGSLR